MPTDDYKENLMIDGITTTHMKSPEPSDLTQLAELMLRSPETGRLLYISSPLVIENGMSVFEVRNEAEKWKLSIKMEEL